MDYPWTPPDVRLLNKVFHPSVTNATGQFCADILKSQWSPSLTVFKLVLSLLSIIGSELNIHDHDDTMGGEAATLARSDLTAFAARAAHWTQLYAM